MRMRPRRDRRVLRSGICISPGNSDRRIRTGTWYCTADLEIQSQIHGYSRYVIFEWYLSILVHTCILHWEGRTAPRWDRGNRYRSPRPSDRGDRLEREKNKHNTRDFFLHCRNGQSDYRRKGPVVTSSISVSPTAGVHSEFFRPLLYKEMSSSLVVSLTLKKRPCPCTACLSFYLMTVITPQRGTLQLPFFFIFARFFHMVRNIFEKKIFRAFLKRQNLDATNNLHMMVKFPDWKWSSKREKAGNLRKCLFFATPTAR